MKFATWLTASSLLVASSVAVAFDPPIASEQPREAESKEKQPEVQRASLLIGHAVVNKQNESLGTIRDLVIDEKGRAHYVIVGLGGVVSENYVAVPWAVMNPRFGADRCMLDMSVDTFQAAPSFTKAKYHERWTKEWCEKTHAYFGGAERANVEESPARKPGDKATADTESRQLFYTSQVIGGNVQNMDQERLATIDDLIFNRSDAVQYAILGMGGVLNIGKSNVAAPFSIVHLHRGEKGTAYAVLDMTSKQLESAPILEKKNYRDLTDDEYVAANDRFFGVTSERQEIEAESPVDRNDGTENRNDSENPFGESPDANSGDQP